MQEQIRVNNMKDMAAHARSLAGKDCQTILVGPPLVYGDEHDDVMAMIVLGAGQVTSIEFGRFCPEMDTDDPLYRLADTVLHIRGAGEVTISEAREKMAELVEETCKLFEHVETFACDKELVRAYVKYWPCDHSRNLAKEMLP